MVEIKGNLFDQGNIAEKQKLLSMIGLLLQRKPRKVLEHLKRLAINR